MDARDDDGGEGTATVSEDMIRAKKGIGFKHVLIGLAILVVLGGIGFGVYVKTNPAFVEKWLHEDDAKAALAAALRTHGNEIVWGGEVFGEYAEGYYAQHGLESRASIILRNYDNWKASPIEARQGDWLWRIDVFEGESYQVWRKGGDAMRYKP